MLMTLAVTVAALLVFIVWLTHRASRPDVLPAPDPITRRDPFDASRRQAR